MKILDALRSLFRKESLDNDPDAEALERRQRAIEAAIAERRRRLERLERQAGVMRRES